MGAPTCQSGPTEWEVGMQRGSEIRYALAIDDDADFRTSLKLMLRMCGFHHVETAADGQAGLELLRTWRFDLVVCDWNMDPMDGIEVLKAVRSQPMLAEVPFMLVTASLSEAAWQGAIEFGATEFLVKPFSLETLRTACQLCLKLGEERRDTGENVISLKERLQARRFRA